MVVESETDFEIAKEAEKFLGKDFWKMKSGFVDGHIEQTTDFDYDEIDERLTGRRDESSAPSELVAAARLLHHIVIIGATNPRETMLWVNVFLFVMGIHPNQNESGERLAQGLKVGKEEWFRRVTRMRKILAARGLFLPRIAGQWGNAGRTSQSNNAVKSWQSRGGKPMLRIQDADKKLNWLAEHSEKLNWDELTPLARQELKAKLLPVLKIYKSL